MMMEIYLNEEKAKQHDIDIEHCYDIIDDYFIRQGVKKISQGIYQGTKKDFTAFVGAQDQLPKTKWFLKIVDQWYCRYLGDELKYREDLLEIYYRVKARNERYFKKQKSTQF